MQDATSARAIDHDTIRLRLLGVEDAHGTLIDPFDSRHIDVQAHGVLVVACPFERLAPRYGAFEEVRIEQGVPDLFAGSVERVAAGNIHWPSSLRSRVSQ